MAEVDQHDAVTTEREPRLAVGLLLGLALLAAISPFSTDLYLPAFPQVAGDLNATPSFVQLTLTAFLLGIAGGQLLFGPVSDRFGRKLPLLVGTSCCLAASVTAALAPTVEILVAARFVQGFTGAAGIVIGRAIVADLTRGNEAARIFSLLAVIGGMAPVLAPLLGGFLADPLGWRGIMWVLVGLTAAMLVVVLLVIPETGSRRRTGAPDPARPRGLFMLRRPGFVGHGLIKLFTFAILMGYISLSPFLYQEMMGLSPVGNGLLFAANSAVLILANSINARLVRRVGPRKMLRTGISILSGAALLLALTVATGIASYWLIVPLMLLVASMGLIFGNSVALAIQESREAAGTGSAFIGSCQFIGGAVAAPLVGLGGGATAVPLAILVLVCTVLTWGCYIVGGIKRPAAAQG